ncbi:MAG: M4 family metallopeptidase [candidate division Zixibacteria bacterium]
MKNLIVCLSFIVLLVGTMAADGKSDSNNLRANSNLTRLEETKSGVPQYVAGDLGQSERKGDEVSTTMAFFEKYKSDYRMTDPERELVLLRAESDRSGKTHLRFEQYYNGLKVMHTSLVSHFSEDGELEAVNGFYRADINLDITPVISSGEAARISLADLPQSSGPGQTEPAELVIFPWNDTYYLSWHLKVNSESLFGRWEYYIDAANGDILYSASTIKSSSDIGTGISVMGQPRYHVEVWNTGTAFQLLDYTRQLNNNIHGHNGQMPDGSFIRTNITGAELPGPVGEDEDNYWVETNQRPGVDAHVYTGLFYDWLLREFGRNSYDNQGASMTSTVNWTGDTYGAYWTGSQVVYPIWGPYTRSWAGCPDVVGHEWAHAITDNCGVLVYIWESGALNESFSDMMGAAFEFAHDTLDPPDWYIEENALPYVTAGRSMSNPEQFGHPSYHGGPNWVDPTGCIPTGNNDFCGVHTNSSVGNKWFYLLSDGDTFRDITVDGISVENAIRIAYHANAYYWTANTDYHDAAIGTYYAALDLDPTGVWAEQVTLAWLAVNVDITTVRLQFSYPLGTPRTIARQQATRVEIEVTGLMSSEPSPGTGQMLYSIDGGPFSTIEMTEDSDNHYHAYLPTLSCGHKVEYCFSAEEAGGNRIYEPDPTTPFSAVVADSSPVLFADDFETDQGWTVTGNAADGQWERGVPLASGTVGAPISDYDGSGSCFLTGNAEGDSDVDNGTTNLDSPSFDLLGTDGVVKFARWYSSRCSDELIAGDPLYVYISNSNGVPWRFVEIIGPNPIFDSGWYEHQFVVSDYIEPTSTMKLRFQISDLGLASCVEAAIDAVEIRRDVCGCCRDLTGNVSDDPSDIVDISDLTRLVNYLFVTFEPLACSEEGNISGDAQGEIDISDLTALVNHLFVTFDPPAPCQ